MPLLDDISKKAEEIEKAKSYMYKEDDIEAVTINFIFFIDSTLFQTLLYSIIHSESVYAILQISFDIPSLGTVSKTHG